MDHFCFGFCSHELVSADTEDKMRAGTEACLTMNFFYSSGLSSRRDVISSSAEINADQSEKVKLRSCYWLA
ncbi:hypothetical protein EZV62_007165 [Acer yangbiense]|uniref:Uncharacterized protein n=1 Tax=Acer yangbiense TaxID=1000413 RepID=A0A5C7I963_9ROSI|nr:hypothetical protein EZV62_007165 [Acer yangbiense]